MLVMVAEYAGFSQLTKFLYGNLKPREISGRGCLQGPPGVAVIRYSLPNLELELELSTRACIFFDP